MADVKKQLEYSEATQTLVGQQRRELMDTKTGELMHVDQITKMVYGSKNFWKCYLMDFLSVLGIMDSKQVDLFIYIVKIAKDVGVSRPTIAKIMKKLQENNFIKRMQAGAWLVNPNILMKGNDNKRQILLSYYESEEPINEIAMSRTKRTPLPNTDRPDPESVPGVEVKENED